MGFFITTLLACLAVCLLTAIITIAMQRSSARSKANVIIDKAAKEAEILKQQKLLEAKEEEMQMKAEAEKTANQRFSKLQQTEAKLKQR